MAAFGPSDSLKSRSYIGLIISALRHLPATRVGIVAMLEPVAAAIVAWAWLGEALDGPQLAGGAVVLAGIVLAQSAR